jgi:ATP-dependent Lon protease
VKEKVLAARRSGIRTVILPEANRKNLEDVPRALRRNMRFVFVRDVQEVFSAALVGAGSPRAMGTRKASRRRAAGTPGAS